MKDILHILQGKSKAKGKSNEKITDYSRSHLKVTQYLVYNLII